MRHSLLSLNYERDQSENSILGFLSFTWDWGWSECLNVSWRHVAYFGVPKNWNFSPLGKYVLFLCQHPLLLYSWRFSRYRAPIHWLVHGHMTSNNETVSRQMPWAGNIAKTMTSNGKQFTVTREMLTAVARHFSITWLFVFQRFDPFALLYNKSLNDWSLGEQWILFPSNLSVSLDFVSENFEIPWETKFTVPLGTSHSLNVCCLIGNTNIDSYKTHCLAISVFSPTHTLRWWRSNVEESVNCRVGDKK